MTDQLRISKRKLAGLLRNGAKLIEEHGWVKNTYGDESIGFCIIGSVRHQFNSVDDYTKYDDGMSFRHVKSSVNSVFKPPGQSISDDADVFDVVTYFNDNIAEKKEDVTRYMRTAARKLEHGGVL